MSQISVTSTAVTVNNSIWKGARAASQPFHNTEVSCGGGEETEISWLSLC